jgi:protein involved in polysaccharide export with SLBB domain
VSGEKQPAFERFIRKRIQSFMKIAAISVVGIFLAAGCSSPKPEAPSASLRPQAQLDPSQPPYIYVNGDFRIPGQYAWTNGMTLQDAISAAHGFTDFAPRGLRIRHSDGSLDFYKLDSKMHLTNNPPVLPGDNILSPRYFL